MFEDIINGSAYNVAQQNLGENTLSPVMKALYGQIIKSQMPQVAPVAPVAPTAPLRQPYQARNFYQAQPNPAYAGFGQQLGQQTQQRQRQQMPMQPDIPGATALPKGHPGTPGKSFSFADMMAGLKGGQ